VEATTHDGARYVGQVQLGPLSRSMIADERGDAQPATLQAPAFALMGANPNPSPTGALTVRFSLPSTEPAQLELIDIAGRRVRAMDLDGIGTGERTVRFEMDRDAPAGLYWLRLTQAGRSASTRVVVVR
jgi:hypothetical protein